ncbi:1-deoxy-D-xylulose-5-phosphate reductoisomerase [Halothiobacillus sp. DCM-1]|uniref:1-deoxy-D-xylulose-5-phosphate reductoisomerase n=1 Tax=Halothiobacillus sp. DCM-1 TaxID=3112558 RepID=UPI003243E726
MVDTGMIASSTEPLGVAIFGATGSIGQSTLAVLRLHPERYRVHALVAHHQIDRLWQDMQAFRPSVVGVACPQAAAELRLRLRQAWPEADRPEVLDEPEAIARLAADAAVSIVVAAIVGTAGLASTWAAMRAGKRVLLANKESLVAAGALMMQAARESGAVLLPVDSEHNAIFQCLPVGVPPVDAVEKLLLTASGGPFRTRPLATFPEITVADACRHPNWSMGRKISVDSASMMNKGLEVIEAAWLFGVPPARIEVVVHPESIIHSMVQFADGSVLAQMGRPDMRTPIAHALAWPDRVASGVAPLDLCALTGLHFEPPDPLRFPCLQLAYDALAAGGAVPLIVNAANEVAVAAFLAEQLAFVEIAPLIEATVNRATAGTDFAAARSIAEVLDQDARARRLAEQILAQQFGAFAPPAPLSKVDSL